MTKQQEFDRRAAARALRFWQPALADALGKPAGERIPATHVPAYLISRILAERDDRDPVRRMRCPVCGHEATSTGIGRVSCGPHRLADGSYSPAVDMVEEPEDEREVDHSQDATLSDPWIHLWRNGDPDDEREPDPWEEAARDEEHAAARFDKERC